VAVTEPLRAPFVWFGGKRRVAAVAWAAFGADVPNYVEPFFGSGAVLLGRPNGPGKIETINDLDGGVTNVWRAIQKAPDSVAEWCDWPVSELDLRARHAWLIERMPKLREELGADADFFDAKVAGWWLWGINQWIGSGWCRDASNAHPSLHPGTGTHSRLGSLGHSGRGVHRPEREALTEWFGALARRLRKVRIASGDWARVVTPAVTGVGNTLGNMGMSPCAVFLDPPYLEEGAVYVTGAGTASTDARKWALANGENPKLRIALCGYEGEHAMPASWTVHAWKATGGYGNQADENQNASRERIWFSPHCLPIGEQRSLFSAMGAP
jgi:hypothetical protein